MKQNRLTKEHLSIIRSFIRRFKGNVVIKFPFGDFYVAQPGLPAGKIIRCNRKDTLFI